VLLSTGTHAWGKVDVSEKIASGGPAAILVDCTDPDAPPTLLLPGEPGPNGYELASDVRDGPNVYAYVKQNPWTAFDPDGLAEVKGYYPRKDRVVRLEANEDGKPLTRTGENGRKEVLAHSYTDWGDRNFSWLDGPQGEPNSTAWEPAENYGIKSPTVSSKDNSERNFKWTNFNPSVDPQESMEAFGEAGNKPLVKGLNAAIQTTFTEGANQLVGAKLVAAGFYVLNAARQAALVEQYTLRAVDSGFYPVMTRGSSSPTGIIWLEKGDVWKFGTTKNPATRYSDAFLRNTGDHGLRYSTEWQGTAAEALQLERMKIMNFQRQNGGALPAGNKIVR
jgi:hypothetical protein